MTAQADAVWDYVVVGSGFGGSVAALRLAQKGYRVLVLEAGKRWGATDFPPSTWHARKYFWSPPLRCHGIQRMDLLDDLLVVSGVGVGGGSLVYGNTLFTPLPSFFDQPMVQRLGGGDAMRPFYELARRMMGVTENPRLFEPDRLLRETADEYGRGHTFTPSPVGVFFGESDQTVADPYFDGEGPARTGCNFCGGCFVGCRHGAKNSLDLNYLHLAEQLGVTVSAERLVTAIEPQSDDGSAGYLLHTRHSTRRRGAPQQSIRARAVVLAGGVLGTLRLLLASQRQGLLPNVSPRLGHGVRTNSEAILGVLARDRHVDYSRGIAASSSVFPDEHTQIQADRYPAGSDHLALMSTLLVDGGSRVPRAVRWAASALRRPQDLLRAALPVGFARRSVILVVMQDIDSSLRILAKPSRLAPGGWRLSSQQVGAERIPTYIPLANDFARRLAKRMGGIPLNASSEVFLDSPVTAHILGGCCMGERPDDGVVDLQHRVFGYRDLLVCDGSVIPVNLGVNPALSILAFTERAMSFVPPQSGGHDAVRWLKVDRRWGTPDLLLSRGNGEGRANLRGP